MARNRDHFGRRISDAFTVDASRYSETLRKLNENRALLRAVFDNVAVGIIYADSKGIVNGINPAAETIIGQARAEVAGKHFHEVFVPYSSRDYKGGLFSYLQSDAIARADGPLVIEILRPGGQSIPVELAVHQTLTREGPIVTLFIRDISASVIAEKKLRIARARAEEATAAKTRFLATMSHEIRTPLNAVLGSLDLLAESSLSDGQRRLLDAARLSGSAVKNVTDDIIDLVAIESGQLKPDHIAFNLFELVEDTAHAVAPGAYVKGLEIALCSDADVPCHVIGDGRRLQQVLMNLISNAIKFTSEGAVTLHLEAMNTQPGSAEIRFWVADTGIGIQNSTQGQLFREFFRGDISNAKEFEGSGLGLAISKNLIRAMGGDVGIKANSGGGSRFWFTVSLGLDTGITQPITPERKLDFGHSLIVKSNLIAARVIKKQLQTWGRKTVIAGSSREAIDYIAQESRAGRPVQDIYLDSDEIKGYWDEWARISNSDSSPAVVLLVKPTATKMDEICGKLEPTVCLAEPIRITDLWIFNKERKFVNKIQGSKNSSATLKGLKQLDESIATAGARILLAEDSEVNQMVVKAMLESEGYIVDIAPDGLQAVAAATSSSYDLILMDLSMPGLDGVAATVDIRRQLNKSCPPIIAMTGNAFADDRARCMEAGMAGFMVKPVDKRQLISNVVAALGKKECTVSNLQPEQPHARCETPVSSHFSGHDDSIDERVLENLCAQVGEPIARTVIQQFLIEARELVTQIANYKGDWNARRLAAHTLKSTAATFGLKKLRAVAGDIEQAFEDHDKRRLAILIPALEEKSRPLYGELLNRYAAVSSPGENENPLTITQVN